MALISSIFAQQVDRRIEEVIKVDQSDEQIIYEEIREYVFTDAIRASFTRIIDRYWETPNKPHEGIGVWVSGFFGSGKSSFAKMLGLGLSNRIISGKQAGTLIGERSSNDKIKLLLTQINEKIPTHAVIFDVSTDRGIRSGNQTITEIMYRLFLESLGYAKDLDLAELEINLEEEGRLSDFKSRYAALFPGEQWDDKKNLVMMALGKASKVMSDMEPGTYPAADSWVKGAKGRADITPGWLAERCKSLMERHKPECSLVFVIDEVGQFVARDVQKMLDLQAVVQNLGRVGRGKMWLIVTSQEKLTELVGGLDDRRVELARLMDRFPQEIQVHLEPSDISEVTSKRVLSKKSEVEPNLRKLFEDNRGALEAHSRLTADIQLPTLDAERFMDLYPLLPYQVDFIIQVVSGLRMQGGASKHVGGANRTIIKLAQQLLINPAVNLAGKELGALASVDLIYDLVEGNISSEIRGRIADIKHKVSHPFAQPVAKAICLLQFVKSIHRTPENIAASLYPGVGADSKLVEVREALDALVKSHMVRHGDDGFRIPTPAEDDWERQRAGLTPQPGEAKRVYSETVKGFWTPQPSYNLHSTKMFKAGLSLDDKLVLDGEIMVQMYFAEEGADYTAQQSELRGRSQKEEMKVFWLGALTPAIEREMAEVYRSKEILSRKERSVQTKDEGVLVTEEKRRHNRHLDELKRLLKTALLSGSVYFRGNDRSPGAGSNEVKPEAEKLLGTALPMVYDRFAEAAAKIQANDLKALMEVQNLHGLPTVFNTLSLLEDQKGVPVFKTDSGPLYEVLTKIHNKTSYGEVASGKFLEEEFAREPFGWDFDIVRLFTVSLLRSGKIEATSKGQTIESALSIEAKNTFTNNNTFRSASFRPKVSEVTFEDCLKAADAFKNVFGKEITELEQGVVADTIQRELPTYEEQMQEVFTLLVSNSLPGSTILEEALGQIRAIRTSKQSTAITSFNGSYAQIKEAIKRANEIRDAIEEPQIAIVKSARQVMNGSVPFLRSEGDVAEEILKKADSLDDLLGRERFYQHIAEIDQNTRDLAAEYNNRYQQAINSRADEYTAAYEKLSVAPGWEQLDETQQQRISEPLTSRTSKEVNGITVPELRADVAACSSRLNSAIEEMMKLLEGNRLVKLVVGDFFKGGIESEEQLDAALAGLRDECARLIGEGKKILVQ
ncbi:BREX system P-loop protein BrxC [Geomonas propionica]|uniref:BREX system P-loop protein BrxC n=1 Tax=Geomonas propionica TaxID=2798582 RepID=A0ABS0YP38_9BACT|nr:BREX system P-loop protein BrxC [Geomonas propionica]MBJ6799741.1 BREX system P-loop protein BrxC [Geomonas propionica]